MKRFLALSLFSLWMPINAFGQSDDFPQILATARNQRIIYFQDGTMTVNLRGILGDQNYLSRIAPQLAMIKVTREQAQAIRGYWDNVDLLSDASSQRWDAAVESGSQELMDSAHEYHKHIKVLLIDAQRDGLKHKINEVFDHQQLEMLKSMGIDLAVNEFGFEKIVYDTLKEMGKADGFQMSAEDLSKLSQAILETEWEMRREIVRLRREAWDRLMKKLPDGMADQIEIRLGLDGIGK